MTNSSTLWFVAGILLLGFGIFYFVTQKAVVGIRGMTRTLHGTGARTIGIVYILIGLALMGAVTMYPASASFIALGGVLAVLAVSIVGYLLAGDS